MRYSKRPPEHLRTKEIKIRVTEAELEHLKLKSGNNLSAYLRKNSIDAVMQIEGKKFTSYPKVDPALVKEISYIGHNLNQIARVINTKIKTKEPLMIASINSELHEIRVALNEVLQRIDINNELVRSYVDLLIKSGKLYDR